MSSERQSNEFVQELFDRARVQFPDARVFALGDDGWFIEAPHALLDAQSPGSAQAETGLDFVVPASRPAVLAAWGRCRSTGIAHAVVHLRESPDQDATLLFVDLRAGVGTFALLVIEAALIAEFGVDNDTLLAPKLSQVRRDETSHFLSFDETATAMFGWKPEAIVGKKSIDFIHPDDHQRAIDNWLQMLGAPGGASRWRGRFLCSDRSWMWVEITNHNRIQHSGEVVTEFLDIRDEMAVHEALRDSEALFRQLTQALPVGVLQTDNDGSVLFANTQLERILGSLPHSLFEFALRVSPSDRDHFEAVINSVEVTGEQVEIEVGMLNGWDRAAWRHIESDPETEQHEPGDSHRIICQLTIGRVTTNAREGLLVCVSDITDKARLREELEGRATFDALTHCHNRASTLRNLTLLLSGPQRTGAGVVFIDLDRFKPVNDEYGHAAGDSLLRTVADRLRGCSRAKDIVGRLGGDEFVVLFSGVTDQETLQQLAERVHFAVNAPIMLLDHPFDLRASLGTALGFAGDDPATVLAAADQAMYVQKRVRSQQTISTTDAGRSADQLNDRH